MCKSKSFNECFICGEVTALAVYECRRWRGEFRAMCGVCYLMLVQNGFDVTASEIFTYSK